MGSYTDILFARPSFAEGMARIMDFGNTLTEYNRSPDPDAIAIAADWNAVAEDLYTVLGQGPQETHTIEDR
jgi:hypothetical protein